MKKQSPSNGLTTAIINYLNMTGNHVWRNTSSPVPIFNSTGKKAFRKFTGLRGVCDIIGVSKSGKFIGIEVKIGKDSLKDVQMNFIHEVQVREGIAFVMKGYQQNLNI